jgi:predicted Zn-dependent peptidase
LGCLRDEIEPGKSGFAHFFEHMMMFRGISRRTCAFQYITILNEGYFFSNRTHVNNAIKKYGQTKNMHVVIVTDKNEAEPLAECLRKNLPSPILTLIHFVLF